MNDVTDDIFNDLMDGFAQIRRHDAGDPDHGLRLHIPKQVDVAAIRKRTGNSQPVFASSIGVPVDTLRQWEQGRRRPQGAALVLLAMLERKPRLVEEILGSPEERDVTAAS
ncbi:MULTISPECIES: helix-turn-helix domain-containing protein [unclassified Methylobacterium]|uniref:helix-turn-helix domain-containing protein n=1 Tax=unclassified Methylobacterium TaxID=2615210 RepID=UPI001353614A|nr:helix-turn-helix domain-containing protein [Methylobacterium sp. 2A]MWV23361.1 helix-turn-helix domain-containing protein [Methylobacterium sp. 2A]